MLNFKMNMPFYLMIFYGSIMIFAVLILHGLLKNKLPKFVFPMLWSVILLRLLIPFSLSSPLSMNVPSFGFLNTVAYKNAIAQSTISIVEDTISNKIPNDEASHANTATSETAWVLETPIPEPIQGVLLTQDEPNTTVRMAPNSAFVCLDNTIETLYPFILPAYLIGLFVTISILFTQKHRCEKRLKDALLVEHNETVNTLLREQNMGHILVFTNDEIASPLVSGLLAPKIYLPTRMDFRNTKLLRHILCHETMHIRRKDNWLKSAMLITLCIHWFNPLVWAMSKCLASDLEMACDEAVLRLYSHGDEAEEQKKNYALSLLAMAITGSRPTLLYSAFSKTEIEKRIQNILHYKKASALLLTFSVCLVLCGSVAFATGGQAPFQPELTAFCSSDNSRWGVKINLTRSVSLGEDAQNRAEKIIFDILRTDTTNDPDILKMQILTALSDAFHVEKSAFAPDFSLCIDSETLFEEYANWGLIRKDKENDMSLLYNGETIRTYSDKMIGRYMSLQEGTVDITVERNHFGEITAVNAFHEGDIEYDHHTDELEQHNWRHSNETTQSISYETATAQSELIYSIITDIYETPITEKIYF